jgi:hypothetical protein
MNSKVTSIILAVWVGLCLWNSANHFIADKQVNRDILSVQRQAANSTSVELASQHINELLTNLEDYKFDDDLSVFPWDEGNKDFSFDLYKQRLEDAVRKLDNSSEASQEETLRTIQDALTDGEDVMATPANLTPAHRWNGNYNILLMLVDIVLYPFLVLIPLWFMIEYH